MTRIARQTKIALNPNIPMFPEFAKQTIGSWATGLSQDECLYLSTTECGTWGCEYVNLAHPSAGGYLFNDEESLESAIERAVMMVESPEGFSPIHASRKKQAYDVDQRAWEIVDCMKDYYEAMYNGRMDMPQEDVENGDKLISVLSDTELFRKVLAEYGDFLTSDREVAAFWMAFNILMDHQGEELVKKYSSKKTAEVHMPDIYYEDGAIVLDDDGLMLDDLYIDQNDVYTAIDWAIGTLEGYDLDFDEDEVEWIIRNIYDTYGGKEATKTHSAFEASKKQATRTFTSSNLQWISNGHYRGVDYKVYQEIGGLYIVSAKGFKSERAYSEADAVANLKHNIDQAIQTEIEQGGWWDYEDELEYELSLEELYQGVDPLPVKEFSANQRRSFCKSANVEWEAYHVVDGFPTTDIPGYMYQYGYDGWYLIRHEDGWGDRQFGPYTSLDDLMYVHDLHDGDVRVISAKAKYGGNTVDLGDGYSLMVNQRQDTGYEWYLFDEFGSSLGYSGDWAFDTPERSRISISAIPNTSRLVANGHLIRKQPGSSPMRRCRSWRTR